MDLELKKSARKFFSGVGFRYSIFFVAVFGGQICLQVLAIMLFGVEALDDALILSLLTALPVDVIGAPIIYLIFKKSEVTVLEKKDLKVGGFIRYMCMLAPLTFGGALISLGLNYVIELITGTHIDNNLVADNINNLGTVGRLIVACVCAPIFEELIFRKLLIDRTVKYGEFLSVLLSGIMFGLFHGNFEQFFYACFLGMFFAHIYIKTGKIVYTMVLHFVVNFTSSGITMFFLSHVDMDFVEKVSGDPTFLQSLTETELTAYAPKLLWLFAYEVWAMVLVGVFIAGVILWILAIKKKGAYTTRELELPKKGRLSVALLNPGMIVYIILCLGLCVYTIFAMMTMAS